MIKASLRRRLAVNLSAIMVAHGMAAWFVVDREWQPSLWLPLLTVCAVGLVAMALDAFLAPILRIVRALELGVARCKDQDFSNTIHDEGYTELGQVIAGYNELVDVLRRERGAIHQRELMLDAVIQGTPVVLLLANERGSIVHANAAACTFFGQPKLAGLALHSILSDLSPALRGAAEQANNGLISESVAGESRVYDLQIRDFVLGYRNHRLFLLADLSSQISRKELDIWKQAIRLVSHELNNSLAPISSLVHSGQKIVHDPERREVLEEIFATIARRCRHLDSFVGHYARFAKLPNPQPTHHDLEHYAQHISRLVDLKVEREGAYPSGYFDAGQVDQVLINLVKNARESGSAPEAVRLVIKAKEQELSFLISDRGTGMNEDRRREALLPFFTTKAGGTGVGLPLCAEIMHNHAGKLRLRNRGEGGLEVQCTMPNRPPAPAPK